MKPCRGLRLAIAIVLGVAASLCGSAQASMQHRIGVRVVNGAGELYDRASGQRFVARGSNFIRLGPQVDSSGATVTYHSMFNVGVYDHSDMSRNLALMQASGYNVVKVFLNELAIGNAAGGLSGPYLDNIADFISLARARDLYVILTTDGTPATFEYSNLLYASCCTLFDGANNLSFLTPGGLQANQKLWLALIAGLQARNVPFDAILGYQLKEELYFNGDGKPLTLASGLVPTVNGKSYDMAASGAKQQMMDENLVFWLDNVRTSILSVDPSAVVMVGMLDPQGPNPEHAGDGRVIDPRPAMLASQIDAVAFDPYLDAGLTFLQLMQNYGVPLPSAKVIMMGEFGASKSAFPSLVNDAALLQRWQVQSCQYGFSGWLIWTWDTESQPGADFWSALSGDALLDRAFNPLNRPDPCKPGSYAGENAALGGTALASSSIPGNEAQLAIDGSPLTYFNSGGFPPQWIDVHLARPVTLSGVRLTTQQAPFVDVTVHNVYVQVGAMPLQLVKQFNAITQDHQVLAWDALPPIAGVTSVRIETTQSPSWVAWQEIQVLATSNITVVTSATPVAAGAPVAFTATIAGNVPGGSVRFSEAGTTLQGCATVGLSGAGDVRSATCVWSSLAPGAHVINADYTGDGGNAPSTGGVVQVVASTTPGSASVVANPYGPLAVQGATLTGATIAGWQNNATIQLGTTPGAANSFARIDFHGLDIGTGGSLTVRSGASGQSVMLADTDDTRDVLAGKLQLVGGNGFPAPFLRLRSGGGLTITSTGAIEAPSGLSLEALGADALHGDSVVNDGSVDGGSDLRLYGASVSGGGSFKGNATLVSSFGNVNHPAHPGHFLANGLQVMPSSGSDVALTINHYGSAPQIFNIAVTGNALLSMPSAWSPGTALPGNNPPMPFGGLRPPGVADAAFGGGSLLVQASGTLTLDGGATHDFVFPGGIVLKAGGQLNTNGVLVNQGWTTSGKAFQGVYFEAPSIVDATPHLRILSNNLNWVNFSGKPAANVQVWQLANAPDGSAQYAIADATAPHINTYSLLVETAASGGCWVCLVNTQPVDVH